MAQGRVDATVPMVFSGRVEWVQIDIDKTAVDLDHLITDEERYRIAMARR